METLPLVSICSTTYNLEKYIAEALDSWLAQVTTFPVEIVICDDCSKDKTVEIVNDYIEKYPGKIRLLTSDKNLGMMPNYIRSLYAATGKYIAICDGDDYWIDANKLQKQVDFLESNSDFIGCLTNSYVISEFTGEKKIAKEQIWDTATSKELLYHDDFHKDNVDLSAGHVSTYIFRNNLIKEYPKWFYDDDVITDFPLFMMNSKFGKTKFINDITSVYRNRAGSHSLTWYGYLKIQNSRIKMYKLVNEFLDYSCDKQIKALIAKHYINIFKHYRRLKNYFKAFVALYKAYLNDNKEVQHYLLGNRVKS
jgi:glycosyltransferase involved in cell wall biosynthesis